jgi:L-lactate permease
MYALIAFIPILVTIVLMVGMNWGAKKALPVSWAVAAVVALIALGPKISDLFSDAEALLPAVD